METNVSFGKIFKEFFYMHCGMLDVNMYRAHRVGKQGVACSGERTNNNQRYKEGDYIQK